jgi:hypothetical protein
VPAQQLQQRQQQQHLLRMQRLQHAVLQATACVLLLMQHLRTWTLTMTAM